jgi:hypothetical protein
MVLGKAPREMRSPARALARRWGEGPGVARCSRMAGALSGWSVEATMHRPNHAFGGRATQWRLDVRGGGASSR